MFVPSTPYTPSAALIDAYLAAHPGRGKPRPHIRTMLHRFVTSVNILQLVKVAGCNRQTGLDVVSAIRPAGAHVRPVARASLQDDGTHRCLRAGRTRMVAYTAGVPPEHRSARGKTSPRAPGCHQENRYRGKLTLVPFRLSRRTVHRTRQPLVSPPPAPAPQVRMT